MAHDASPQPRLVLRGRHDVDKRRTETTSAGKKSGDPPADMGMFFLMLAYAGVPEKTLSPAEYICLYLNHAHTLKTESKGHHGFQTLELLSEARSSFKSTTTADSSSLSSSLPRAVQDFRPRHIFMEAGTRSSITGLLDRVRPAVVQLLGRYFFGRCSRPTLTIINVSLHDINLILRVNIRILKDFAQGKEKSGRAIEPFVRDVNQWLAINKASPRPSTANPKASQESPCASGPSTELTTPQPPPAKSHQRNFSCPVEDIMPHGWVKDSSCDATLFISFISKAGIPLDESFAKFGVVRSIHHFRSRKAPLHHEFVVVSLVNANGVASWLRFERAARLKIHPLALQSDSFSPLRRGGATLRETITFASSLDALVSDDDQLASLSLDVPILPNPATLQMLLHILVFQVMHSTRSQPRYQLFSANCRWFARRLILNLIQWAHKTGVPHEITWRDKPSTFDDISKKLQKEWFGGGQLEDIKGAQVQIENNVSLALQLQEQGDTSGALTLSHENLSLLEAPFGTESRHNYLLIRALHTLGTILQGLGRLDEALQHLERACSIARLIYPEWSLCPALVLARYADVLEAIGRNSEACEIAHEAVKMLRPLSTTFPFELATIMHSHAQYLIHADRRLDALRALRAELEHRHTLFLDNSSKYREALLNSIALYRHTLFEMDRIEEACEAARQAVTITRAWLAEDPPGARVSFARSLLTLGELLGRAEKLPEALDILEEAVRNRRLAYSVDPKGNRSGLVQSLESYANILVVLGRIPEACGALRDALDRTAKSSAADDQESRIRRLYALQILLYSTKPLEAIAHFREAISILRELHVINPDQHHDRLGTYLERYAEMLDHQHLGEAACDAINDSIALARESYVQQPDTVPPELPRRIHYLGLFIRRAANLEDFQLADIAELMSTGSIQSTSGNRQTEDAHNRSVHAFQESMVFLRKSKTPTPDKDSISPTLMKKVRSSIDIERAKYTAAPSSVQGCKRFGDTLLLHAKTLWLVADKPEACEIMRECVVVTRALLERDPSPSSLLALTTRLQRFGTLLHQVGRLSEASDLFSEALAHARSLYEIDPSSNLNLLQSTLAWMSISMFAAGEVVTARHHLREGILLVMAVRFLADVRADTTLDE